MSCTQVYGRFKCFKVGHESFESDKCSGRPLTNKTDHNVHAAVQENRQITIRKLTDYLNIRGGSVQSILTGELGMRHVSANFLPKVLTADQKDGRVSVTQDLLECAKNDESFI